jgi:hypothetical protein
LVLSSCARDEPTSESAAAGSPGGGQPSSRPAKPGVAGHCVGDRVSRTVEGDVTVPAGRTCELRGIRVDGNISVGHGARLYARAVDVDGDIEGEGTAVVEVTDGSRVGGNLQLDSGGSAVVSGSRVGGDISWEEQHGTLRVDRNTVSGNVELDGNTRGITVSHNDIHGDLTCQENAHAPGGGGNSVSGNRESQCRGL